ncbi:hypothetical protein DPEC_G00059950 [Dallia pectoralis]|uniref:Uncharacterized protein n=1 Tax=Dallia pectoralis TaxID=75939 RepID=A0ACC2H792_DALPE|nr:hypothetical protein DPEC_G00059950 [Dallia pectoralis]
MEGEPEEQKEDSEAHERAFTPHTFLLWEKCIQQSIFVDLSEDESLHFSDLEGSFTVQLSQADSAAMENSIHLSGNVELSVSDQRDSTGKSSCVSSRSDVAEGEMKSSVMPVSAQRPNTEQEPNQTIWDYKNPADTSDEDQEDLPYDEDMGSQFPKTNDTDHSEDHLQHSLNDCSDLPAMVKQVNVKQDPFQIEMKTLGLTPMCESKESLIYPAKPAELVLIQNSPVVEGPYPDITELLLRHFPQDELLCSDRLIEAETLPEVSLLDSSVDETFWSRVPRCSRTGSSSRDVGSGPQCSSTEGHISKSGRSQDLQDKHEESSVVRNTTKILEEQNAGRISKSPTVSKENDRGCADESYNSDVNCPENSDRSNSKSCNGLDLIIENCQNDEDDEEDQVHIVPLIRTRSFSELKYGQGQVHFPLPDFTKVAPKVKVPKNSNGPVRPVSQSPAFLRTKSSPGMLGRSSALEVINRAMEDYIQPSDTPYKFRDQDNQTEPASGLVHHLQAEYDKLLTKYAEAENLIDKMRLGTNKKALSEFNHDIGDQEETVGPVGGHFVSMPFPKTLTPSGVFTDQPNQQNHSKQPDNYPTHTGLQDLTEGERMTCEFRDIISQFMQKVVDFKTGFTTKSFTVEEQHIVFKSIMGALDQLERRYISKKEEHRALEMQNFIGLTSNTGQFDPERQVEGEIFRIGMHLEDIKDLLDRNVCEQKLSPTHSSLTPLPLGQEASPGLLRHSPPPDLPQKVFMLQDPSNSLSAGGHEPEDEGTNEIHGYDGLNLSCELPPDDSLVTSTGHSSVSLRLSQGSIERQDITNKDKEEAEGRAPFLSERIAHARALQNPRSQDRLWKPGRWQQSPLSPDVECFLGESLCSAVEVPSPDGNTQNITDQTPTSSQRILSPETDSGFGSSDLSGPPTGLTQPQPNNECFRLQSDGNSSPLSLSDSEGSCSHLQTTRHQPRHTEHRRPSLQSPVHLNGDIGDQRSSLQTPKDRRPSLQKNIHLDGYIGDQRPSFQTSTQLQLSGTAGQVVPAGLTDSPSQRSSDCQLKRSHSVNMDTLQRDWQSHSCSCHSEAIQALQSEVSQLKRDMEKGLVQLPYLSQRMDQLTSRYRRPKPRSITTQLNPGSRQSLTTNKSKIEDWISSDMDLSRSIDTDIMESDRSGITLPFHSTPLGVRRGSSKPYLCLDGQWKSQGKTHFKTAAEENLTYSSPPVPRLSHRKSSLRYPSPPGDLENVSSKGRYRLFSLDKPLLQVNYGSSCSLPAGFKAQEQQSVSHYRRRSTQSDSALLPSNVFFQRTLPPALSPPRTRGRAGRHKTSKDEDINRMLDRAIEAAKCMKKTTDRMAKCLSVDLAKAGLSRRLCALHPLTGS